MKPYIIAAAALQIIGTVILALFSFWGVKISENKNAYFEGVQNVSIHPRWLKAARFGLFFLVIGIVISAVLDYCAAV